MEFGASEAEGEERGNPAGTGNQHKCQERPDFLGCDIDGVKARIPMGTSWTWLRLRMCGVCVECMWCAGRLGWAEQGPEESGGVGLTQVGGEHCLHQAEWVQRCCVKGTEGMNERKGGYENSTA